ncbi:adenylate/guanylate cyclase [Erythrobacter sp. NAP1]|uniref:adenylate/guanylate cyclase domain-containing protein n=1 Tax=Erythrobacter sp. NAP1 TaxID=237727 RepID=UPI0000686D38|nr:adenylate/guanylate cyclase domain-containing protein [Erythrobacter sp. NAP1]EAQ30383.1 adenylate/guanylate cyclase [Erythrobacter sp. NAP1]
MLARFDDPAVEKAYVMSEREARVPATRFLAGIGIVTLISYIGFNPMHFPPEGVIAYNMAAIPFMLVLTCIVGLTFTRFYIEQSWIDLVIFIAMTVVMVLLIEALGEQSDITEISRFGMGIINFGILVVFASVGFVATTRYFFSWAVVLLLTYATFLLIVDRNIVNVVYSFTNFTTFFTFACFVNWDIDRRARRSYKAWMALEEERAKTEEMLFNVLPKNVANRLRRGEVVADSFSDVSVVFVDIVGFSKLARKLSPGHLVKLLNAIFGLADECAKNAGVEKVKTIGDAYLAVAGGTTSTENDAVSAIRFAEQMIAAVTDYARETRIDVAIRVGIHTGPVVGGVIGQQRMAYDYWGDTMNTAARLEGVAKPGGIAVSESTYFAACSQVDFTPAELQTLKGIGETKVYRVIVENEVADQAAR